MAEKRGQLMVFAIIALMLLLLAAVVFGTGGIDIFGPGNAYKARDVFYTSSVGTVGDSKGTFRHITLGRARIGLSLEAGPSANVEGPVTVARGVLTAEDYVMSVPAGALKDGGVLDFQVESTNGLGTLMTWVNGVAVWSGNPKAGESIETKFAAEAGAANEVRFSVTSSGFRLWSPSVYELGKIQIRESEQVQIKQDFEFEVSKAEVDDWSIGRVVFQIADSFSPAAANAPDLILKVNNATIFAGKPAKGSLPVLVDFGKAATAIREGNNSLSFEIAGEGQYDIAGTEVIIFSNAEGRREPSFRFELTQGEIDGLREGALNGIVTFRVMSPGTLSVSLVGASGGEKVLLREAWKDAGTVDLPFGWQQVTPGTNTLSFNASGGSSPASIGELWVKLYR